MIRFPLIPLCALALLAACATPQERCLRDAAAPWREALEERARIARDLARGYTFETEFERVTRYRICRANKDTVYPCWETDMQPVTKRVPVDAAVLQSRDAELARALPGLRAAAERDTAQCRILYPETETAPEDA